METKLTEQRIQKLLVNRYITGGFRVNLCVPNVSFGYFSTHEADLVVVSKAGYITEFEIKRTWNDFLADFRKKTNHFENKVLRMYYVVPENIAEQCMQYLCDHYWDAPFTKGLFDIPCPVGLIAYNEDGGFKTRMYAPELNKYTLMSMQAYKLTSEEYMQLARLGVMRLWS